MSVEATDMSKEAMKQWADDVSKAYDILAFGNTERAAEILGKTRDAIRKALAEQHLQDLHDENVRLGLYEQEKKLVGTVGDLFDEGVIWMRQLDRDLLVYTAPSQSKPAQQGSDK